MRKKVAWYTTYENDPVEQKKLGLQKREYRTAIAESQSHVKGFGFYRSVDSYSVETGKKDEHVDMKTGGQVDIYCLFLITSVQQEASYSSKRNNNNSNISQGC